ncbi:transcription initiation factor TFIID subunit 8-like [Periplaneta americana]|uniref:transcription initiation factor TFIID subunit 8-like n=1 Tax=Periplaneta americana TaxID=6978 RepID=UPI0037E94D65
MLMQENVEMLYLCNVGRGYDSAMDGLSSNLRRRPLQVAVAGLLSELGYDTAERMAHETLIEQVQSLITQIGISARSYCELSGRTEPVIGDVIIALVNMGVSVEGIEAHARRPGRTTLPALVPSTQPKQLSILQAGVKQPHPPHIPTHLPPFPDPHAYIRTPTHKQPVTEYEAIREKSATQKRDTERALTRFVAKTSETHSLFLTEDTIFPLIACKPHNPPYLKALLPSDQVFEFEDEFATPACSSRGGPGPSRRSRAEGVEGDEEETSEESKENADEGKGGETDTIDNPYLRPVKLPRKKKPKM